MTTRFAPDPTEVDYLAVLRDLLRAECPPTLIRDVSKRAEAYRHRLWPELARAGLLGAIVPEDAGGGGTDTGMLVLLFEELGRAAAPGPLVESIAVVAPLLAALDGDAKRWASAIVAGEVIATASFEPHAHVAFADTADIVLCRLADQLHIVDRESVRLRPELSIDRTRPLFGLDWKPDGSTLVGCDAALIELAFDRGALAIAAMLVGLSEAAIAQAVAYTRERQQFGRAVGSFQAVQHLLADAHVGTEFATALVRHAGAALAGADEGLSSIPAPVLVSMAKIAATRAARLAAENALQAHGAMGYSHEYDLHIWLTRMWTLLPAWGDLGWHRGRVAAHALGHRP